jgi:hypothetical protein
MTTSEFPLPDSSSPLHYPEWQLPYQAALLEVDPKKLAERVAEAEGAIFNRLQRLSQSQNRLAERQTIEDAIKVLKVIKRDRLGFPDWESGSSRS